MSGNGLNGLVAIMFGATRSSSARRNRYKEVNQTDSAGDHEATYHVEVAEQLPPDTRNVSGLYLMPESRIPRANDTYSERFEVDYGEDEVEEESEENEVSVFVADDSEALREMREYRAVESIRELQKKVRDYLSKKDRGDARYEHESDSPRHAKSPASVAEKEDDEEEYQDPELGLEESKYIDDLLAEVARRRGNSLTDRLPSAVGGGDIGHGAESDDGSVLYSNRRARTVSFGNEDDAIRLGLLEEDENFSTEVSGSTFPSAFPSYMAGEDKEDGSGE